MLNQGFKDDQGEVVVHERTLPQRFQRRFVTLLHREKRRLHFDCVGGAAVLKAAVQMLRGLVVMVHPPGCASGQQAGVDVAGPSSQVAAEMLVRFRIFTTS